VLYGTTDEFLHQFGLGSLDDLPPLPEEPAATAGPTLTHM
jgi:chromosome segregation and condensation protein ScpB